MKKFNNIYKKIILENLYPNIYYDLTVEQTLDQTYKLLNKEYKLNPPPKNRHIELFDITAQSIILEKRYFDCISQSIEDFFVNKFLEIKNT